MNQASHKSIASLLLIFICVLTSSLNLVHAQANDPYQISGELVPLGDVSTYQISPDGKHVVYIADQEIDELPLLYSVPISGGTPVRLSQPIIFFLFPVSNFKISQDSKYVVFRQGFDGRALYSVPITGGDNVFLHEGSLNNGLEVQQFDLSEDSQRVIYIADQDVDEVFELYSVAINGGAPLKLNPNPISDGAHIQIEISPNSQRVVYQADQDTEDVFELYSVPITGGATLKLNSELVLNGSVLSFQVSPDGNRVIYKADQERNSELELYSVPIDSEPTVGGRALKLSSELNVGRYQISPDGQRAIYAARGRLNREPGLYSISILGGSAVKITPDLPLNHSIKEFKITPDSARVAYIAGQARSGVFDLYSVAITGGTLRKLSIDQSFFTDGSNFKISQDSQRLVYQARPLSGDRGYALYSVSILGENVIRLNENVYIKQGGGFNSVISSDSQRVIYSSFREDATGVRELYSVPIRGGQASKLNSELTFSGSVVSFAVSANGKNVVYLADQDVFGERELFALELPEDEEELCVPIKAKNGNIALICL